MGTRTLTVTRGARSLDFLPIYSFSTKNYSTMSVPNHPLPFASKKILPNTSAIVKLAKVAQRQFQYLKAEGREYSLPGFTTFCVDFFYYKVRPR